MGMGQNWVPQYIIGWWILRSTMSWVPHGVLNFDPYPYNISSCCRLRWGLMNLFDWFAWVPKETGPFFEKSLDHNYVYIRNPFLVLMVWSPSFLFAPSHLLSSVRSTAASTASRNATSAMLRTGMLWLRMPSGGKQWMEEEHHPHSNQRGIQWWQSQEWQLKPYYQTVAIVVTLDGGWTLLRVV